MSASNAMLGAFFFVLIKNKTLPVVSANGKKVFLAMRLRRVRWMVLNYVG